MEVDDVLEMVEIAANLTADEKNEYHKFHFMLRADKDTAKQWEDSPIPFPSEKYVNRNKRKAGGTDQLPSHIVVNKQIVKK